MPTRLTLRIYFIGLLQFLVIAIAVTAVQRIEQSRMTPFGTKQARYVAEDLARVWNDRAALQQATQRAATTLDWTVEVWDVDGALLVHAAPAYVAPVDPLPRAKVPIQLADGRTAALGYDVHPPRRLGMSTSTIVALAVVVGAIGAFLTARSLARPLSQLSGVARTFGKGRLDVRTGMDRKDEIGDVARAFDDMADRIAKLLLAERELLANVSHELRTPLARIRVALDLANEGDARMAVESLGEIAQDLGELERIVDDVLESARLALDVNHSSAAPALLVRAEQLDTKALLEKSVLRFRAAHPKRTLSVTIEDDLPGVFADTVLMRRVVDNLLDNAHKYTEDAAEAIALDAWAADDGVMIEIEDHGIGISKGDLNRLFEPFFRADRSRTRATGGLGLGLTLARRIVDAHEGALTFTSEVEKGTVARVWLPAAPGASPPTPGAGG